MTPPNRSGSPEKDTPNWLAGMEDTGLNPVKPGPPPPKKLPASFSPKKLVLRKSKDGSEGGENSSRDVVRESCPDGNVNAAGPFPTRLTGSPDGELTRPGPLSE
jgi:hypothetical protein